MEYCVVTFDENNKAYSVSHAMSKEEAEEWQDNFPTEETKIFPKEMGRIYKRNMM